MVLSFFGREVVGVVSEGLGVMIKRWFSTAFVDFIVDTGEGLVG